MALTLRCRFSCLCVAICLALGVSVSQVEARALDEMAMVQMYEQWMAEYGIVYEATEKEKRFLVFKDNVERINSFNEVGNKPFNLSVNRFADLTDEEFKAGWSTGFMMKSTSENSSSNQTVFKYKNASLAAVPASRDWRMRAAVTNIKRQGSCGACWAFSAVAAIEGINKIMTRKLVSFSEQEVIDCDTVPFVSGCRGGNMEAAFDYVAANHGLATESGYPYRGIQGTCQRKQRNVPKYAVKVSGHRRLPTNNEWEILKAVARQPVSVAVEGTAFAFRFYKGGILTANNCGTKLNHAITLIGYGVDARGMKYWLAKNSWGTEWGENGYMKLQRDVTPQGVCGLAIYASFPTVS